MPRRPETLCSAACVICGGDVKARGAKTCSRPCYMARMREVSALGTATLIRAAARYCEICGARYRRTYPEQRTCGRECGVTLKRRNRGPSIRSIPETPVAIVAVAECEMCEVAFVTPDRDRTTCSTQCAKRLSWRRSNEKRRSEWDQSARGCPVCFADFRPTGPLQRYCTDACMKRARRRRERLSGTRSETHRQRALRYGRRYERVSPRAVFERDGWTCHLCRKPVPRDKKAPHPLSPTLDHIIPMSVPGGDHVYENVRTAHFRCNSLRGTGGTVQLLLIG